MDSLSIDLLRAIFQELDPVMLCRLAKVSKDFRVAADEDCVWNAAHGFTKQRSLATLVELSALSGSKDDECMAAASVASNSEYEGSSEDDTDDAISRRDRAYEAWDKLQQERHVVQRMHAIAYRMLRVPKKLRVVAADALVHYYKVTQCIDFILKGVPRCSDDDTFASAYRDLNLKRTEAEHALIDADVDVRKWENAFSKCGCVSHSSTYTPAFCCTQQPWGTSPPLENLEQSWMYE
jgi:hypothetical protein